MHVRCPLILKENEYGWLAVSLQESLVTPYLVKENEYRWSAQSLQESLVTPDFICTKICSRLFKQYNNKQG